MSTLTQEQLDAYVTDRLLHFYEGLIERGQILPPAQKPSIEMRRPTLGCKADRGYQSDRAQFDGAPQHSTL